MSDLFNIQSHPNVDTLRGLLQKEFSPEEQQQLEQMLEDDPFLADALEGLTLIEDTVELKRRLKRIRQLSQKRIFVKLPIREQMVKRRSRVIPMKLMPVFGAAAAGIALVLVFVFILDGRKEPNSETEFISQAGSMPILEDSAKESSTLIQVQPIQEERSMERRSREALANDLASPREEREIAVEILMDEEPNTSIVTTDPITESPQETLVLISEDPVAGDDDDVEPEDSFDPVARKVIEEEMAFEENNIEESKVKLSEAYPIQKRTKKRLMIEDSMRYVEPKDSPSASSSTMLKEEDTYPQKEEIGLNRELSSDYGIISQEEMFAQIQEEGDTYFVAGEYALAIQKYEELLEQNPKDPLLMLQMGRSYHAMGQYKHAHPYLKRTARAEGEHQSVAMFLYAKNTQKRGQLDKAARMLREIVSQKGQYAEEAEQMLKKVTN